MKCSSQSAALWMPVAAPSLTSRCRLQVQASSLCQVSSSGAILAAYDFRTIEAICLVRSGRDKVVSELCWQAYLIMSSLVRCRTTPEGLLSSKAALAEWYGSRHGYRLPPRPLSAIHCLNDLCPF